MKILVTGVGGQLGHDVMNELAAGAIRAWAATLPRYTAALPTAPP